MEKSALKISREIDILSLKELCLIKIATKISNNQQLRQLILKCYFFDDIYYKLCSRKMEEWKAVEEMANEIVLQICNSNILRDSILEMLWSISYRIIVWKSTYLPEIHYEVLPYIYWTDRGRIDAIRTLKQITICKYLPINERFRLACSLCLSDEIGEFWSEISKKDVRWFFRKQDDKFCPLIYFWADIMEGSDYVIVKYMKAAIQCAVNNKLLPAIKHLFSLVDADEKFELVLICFDELQSIIRRYTFLEEDEIDICCFLISQIEIRNENWEAINLRYNLLLLTLLFHSSENEYFLNELKRQDDFRDAEIMLLMIFETYHLDILHDNDYRTLFFNTWHSISASAKSFVARETEVGTLCLIVLIKNDFPFLLEEGALEKVAEFTSSNLKSSTPLDLKREKWEFLEFIIKEGMMTVPTMKKDLEHLIKYDRRIRERVETFVSEFGKILLQ